MAYSDKVVDHYNNPRNVGSMRRKTPMLARVSSERRSAADVMKLQMKINPDTQVI